MAGLLKYADELDKSLERHYTPPQDKIRKVLTGIGRYLSLPTNTVLGRPQDSFVDPTKEDVEPAINKVLEKYKDQLNGNHPTGVYLPKDVNDPMSLLSRSTSYNPFTKTIQTFSRDPAFAAHEAGHHVDFAQSKNPGLKLGLRMAAPTVGKHGGGLLGRLIGKDPKSELLGSVIGSTLGNVPALQQEFAATRNAVNSVEGEQRSKYLKSLIPAYGTYVGSALAPATGYALSKGDPDKYNKLMKHPARPVQRLAPLAGGATARAGVNAAESGYNLFNKIKDRLTDKKK